MAGLYPPADLFFAQQSAVAGGDGPDQRQAGQGNDAARQLMSQSFTARVDELWRAGQ